MLRILGTRPPSVWLAQLMLVGGAFLLLLWPLKTYLTHPGTYVYMFDGFGDRVGPDEILSWSLKALAYLSPFIVVPSIAAFGLAKRKQWGRWLSVIVITGAFPCACLLWALIVEGCKHGGFSFLEAIVSMVFLIPPGVCLLLIARLAFGKPEKKFFESEVVHPPPSS